MTADGLAVKLDAAQKPSDPIGQKTTYAAVSGQNCLRETASLEALAGLRCSQHMAKIFGHSLWILVLTLLTQVGGVAWLLALWSKHRLVVFAVLYVALSASMLWIAPLFGRHALSCFEDGPLQVQNPLYCVLNRTYVSPDINAILVEAADTMAEQYPGTVTLVLDGSFPLFDGFPLLPHLSHDDGNKVDLAFYYAEGGSYLPGQARSPIGYFAFEEGPTPCGPAWLTLRWNMTWLQPMLPKYDLEPERLRALLRVLADDARVGKVLIEPHLLERLDVASPKFRFQGCRAARHDDHIHLQL